MAVIECQLQIEQPRIYRRVSDSFLSIIFRLRICLLRCHLEENFNAFNFFVIIIKKEKNVWQDTIPTAKLIFFFQDEVERRRHMKWLNTLQFLWS